MISEKQNLKTVLLRKSLSTKQLRSAKTQEQDQRSQTGNVIFPYLKHFFRKKVNPLLTIILCSNRVR